MIKNNIKIFILIFLMFGFNQSLFASDYSLKQDEQLKVGWDNYDAGNFNRAFDIFSQLALEGNTKAKVVVGFMYDNGKGVEVNKEEAVKWYLYAAEEGEVFAQLSLGLKFLGGDGVDEDRNEAKKWLTKAAEQGDAEAQYFLGYYHEGGNKAGAEIDYTSALKWYTAAAEQDHVQAQFRLGLMYLDGVGQDKNKMLSLKWLSAAKNNGSDNANFILDAINIVGEIDGFYDTEKLIAFKTAHEESNNENDSELDYIGRFFTLGSRTEMEYKAARTWLRVGSHYEKVDSILTLAFFYETGKGGALDTSAANELYEKAYDLLSPSERDGAGMRASIIDHPEPNYSESIKWYHISAINGDADAFYKLYKIYKNGYEVPEDKEKADFWFNKFEKNVEAKEAYIHAVVLELYEQDTEEKFDYLNVSAKKGNPAAQSELGMFFARKKDWISAKRWFEKGAEQGSRLSQRGLGFIYKNGNGVDVNLSKSNKWFELAAQQDDTDSQVQLAINYFYGQGVIKDYLQSYMWANIAASKNPDISELRDQIEKSLTADQVKQGMDLARKWVEDHRS